MLDSKTRHYYLSFLVAFMLPLSKEGVIISVVLVVLNWLTLGKNLFRIGELKNNIPQLILLVFYFWHIIGLLWSDNIDFGLFDLEIKLSFILFPVIFSAFGRFKVVQFERILKGYLLGCSLAILIGIINSIWAYIYGENAYLDFYEHNISPILHISYFAMYLNLALVICFYLIVRSEKNFYSWRNVGLITLSFVFALATFLSTSKNGFLALIFLLLIIATYAVVRYRKWLLGISAVLVVWIVASSLLKDINSGSTSFHGFNQVTKVLNEDEVSKQAGESTAVRVLIWKSSWELIKQSPLIGVGTGDVKDELKANYKLNGFEEPFKKNYNAHNQFFQTAVALGGIGLLLLLAGFAIPAILSFARANYLYLMFTINIAVACLTESILEVQAGVIYFSFFTCLFSQILSATSSRKINFSE